MASEWEQIALSEISVSFDALRIPVKESERRSGKYPYYGASGIVDHVDSFIFDGDYLLVAEDGENLKTRKTPIAFMARGQFWVNNHAHILRGNGDALTEFLCYALQVADIHSFLSGSTMPKLTQGNLSKVSVYCPPLSAQRNIVGLLGALDEKIARLESQAACLEEIARAIFKSWFVDFDPVRAKAEGQEPEGMDAATAALFPAEFVKFAKGQAPSGWSFQPLSEFMDINPSRSLAKNLPAPYLEMANAPTSGPRPAGWVDRLPISGCRFRNGDTLLAKITPCLENGKTVFVDFLNEDQIGWGSTEFIVLAPKSPIPAVFGYLLARDEDFRVFAIQSMSGTSGRQRIQVDQLAKFEFAVADAPIYRAFAGIVEPIFSAISHNDNQAKTLAELRDTLLPRLISGKLRIPEAEKLVEAVL